MVLSNWRGFTSASSLPRQDKSVSHLYDIHLHRLRSKRPACMHDDDDQKMTREKIDYFIHCVSVLYYIFLIEFTMQCCRRWSFQLHLPHSLWPLGSRIMKLKHCINISLGQRSGDGGGTWEWRRSSQRFAIARRCTKDLLHLLARIQLQLYLFTRWPPQHWYAKCHHNCVHYQLPALPTFAITRVTLYLPA